MGSDDSAEWRFGQRVRNERERRGWTQAELAERLGRAGLQLHPSAIAKIEIREPKDGKPRAIRLNEATVIAKVLGVPLKKMLLGSPQEVLDEHGEDLNRAVDELYLAFDEVLAIIGDIELYLGVVPAHEAEILWTNVPAVLTTPLRQAVEQARASSDLLDSLHLLEHRYRGRLAEEGHTIRDDVAEAALSRFRAEAHGPDA
jgi:transcriptional regulator with XRE-family HTH domain